MSKQKIGENIVCQVGLIVRDVQASARVYSEIFGVPEPEIIMTDAPKTARTKYKGKATDARAKLAFFSMGQVSLELIEPVGGPSTWKDFLDEKGEGVHHIAFMVQGTDEVVARLEKQGISLIQQGRYTGGMYSYLDSEAKLGVILELLENF